MTLMIGLTGPRGVGKSEIANFLVSNKGWRTTHAFAAGKAATFAYYTHIGIPEPTAFRMVHGDLKDTPQPLLPGGVTSRYFMEQFGRWLGNDLEGGADWTLGVELRRMLRRDNTTPIILESLVYEVDTFRRLGGIVVRVERPGHSGPVGMHTDVVQAAIVADHTFVNDADDLFALDLQVYEWFSALEAHQSKSSA